MEPPNEVEQEVFVWDVPALLQMEDTPVRTFAAYVEAAHPFVAAAAGLENVA